MLQCKLTRQPRRKTDLAEAQKRGMEVGDGCSWQALARSTSVHVLTFGHPRAQSFQALTSRRSRRSGSESALALQHLRSESVGSDTSPSHGVFS